MKYLMFLLALVLIPLASSSQWVYNQSLDNFNDASFNHTLWGNISTGSDACTKSLTETGGYAYLQISGNDCVATFGTLANGSSYSNFKNWPEITRINSNIDYSLYKGRTGIGGESVQASVELTDGSNIVTLFSYTNDYQFTTSTGNVDFYIIINKTSQVAKAYVSGVLVSTNSISSLSKYYLKFRVLSTLTGGEQTAWIKINYVNYSDYGDTRLVSPSSGSTTYFDSSILNITAYPPNNQTLKNATVYFWNSTDLINTSTNAFSGKEWNSTLFNVSHDIVDNYYWNALVCTEQSCIFNDNNNTLIYGFYNQDIYNSTTYETSLESIITNLTVPSGKIITFANLIYGGQTYSGTITNPTTNNYLLTKQFSIPLGTGNVNFYWNVTYSTGEKFQTPNRNITIDPINFSICPVPDEGKAYVNYSIFKLDSPTTYVSSTFKSSWSLWLGDGSVKANYSFNNPVANASHYSFCFNPISGTINTDVDIEFSSDGYSSNNYYHLNNQLDNSTDNQHLYLLNVSDATITSLRVVNYLQQGVPDIIINIYEYDIGTGGLRLASVGKSNYDGYDSVYLNWYDTLYKFVLLQNNTVIRSFDPFKVALSPQTFKLTSTTSFEDDKFANLIYNFSYDEDTKTFSVVYSDSSQGVTYGCIRVSRYSLNNVTTINDTCLAGYENSFTVTIPETNGTFAGMFYAEGSYSPIETLLVTLDVRTKLVDLIGKKEAGFISILLIGTLSGLLLITPTIAIVGAILGLFATIALGIQSNVTSIALVGIICLALYIIWKVRE